jgi:CBS domain-containing protein
MKRYKVKDLVVPISEYGIISEDASIFEAVMALEKAQLEFDTARYRHRAILVMDHRKKIVGKLSQLDILRSLEPKYEEMREEGNGMKKFGFSRSFLLSMLESYKLFDLPFDDICRKAGQQKVKTYMHRPTEGEYIDETATLDEAVHLLVSGHHQSLLVMHQKDIVGILRLTDVFAAVFHTMKSCNQKESKA